MVDRDDVLRARETIGDRLARTPMLSSRTLGARLKCELFQRTGSFKVRGALNKLSSLTPDEKQRGVIAISAGNHAQATAFAAAAEGVDALVVMWQGASELKIAATRGYGAQVDLEAADPPRRSHRLDVLLAETGRVLVHPFDDPVVIAGAGTVGLEIEEDAPDADVVVVARGRWRSGRPGSRSRSATASAWSRSSPRRARRCTPAIAAGQLDPGRAALDRRRPERAVRGRAADRDLPRSRARARDRGGDRARLPLPLRADEARLRTGRPRRPPRPCSRARLKPRIPVAIVSGATSRAKLPLLFWPLDEDRNSPGLRALDRALRLRKLVRHALHKSRS